MITDIHAHSTQFGAHVSKRVSCRRSTYPRQIFQHSMPGSRSDLPFYYFLHRHRHKFSKWVP
jgi:hypothetical protein